MQVQVARISPVVMELAVEVPASDVKLEVEKAYVTLQRKARIRGFRPGKAPREVLARIYWPQVASDVMNTIVQGTLPKAISDQKVTPINQPQVEAGKLEAASPFSYKARFEVTPDVGDVSWEGLELWRPVSAIGEKEVDEQIEMLRKAHARLEAPDPARPAQKGDVVTIDFTLAVDGKDLKDGGGQGQQVELGSPGLLPELEAALVGKKIDDAVEAVVKLPADHPSQELRGKSTTFHIKVKDLKERILPAVDDELAKDVGSFQTLVELRADIHTKLEKHAKDRADTVLAEQIVDQLNTKNDLAVPPSLVEQQCRMTEYELMQNARRMGQRPSQQDFQRVHDQVHADSEKKVRAGLLMAAIAKKLGIEVKEPDIEQGYQELAAESGKNVAKIKAEYNDPQRRQVLIGMILEDKVLDAIEGKAKIHEGDPPAKKDAASGEPNAKAESKAEAKAGGGEAPSQESASKAKKKTKAKE